MELGVINLLIFFLIAYSSLNAMDDSGKSCQTNKIPSAVLSKLGRVNSCLWIFGNKLMQRQQEIYFFHAEEPCDGATGNIIAEIERAGFSVNTENCPEVVIINYADSSNDKQIALFIAQHRFCKFLEVFPKFHEELVNKKEFEQSIDGTKP